MNASYLYTACFALGFASIAASIALWMMTGGETPELQAHSERLAIFVGLWAPTFFILASRFAMTSAPNVFGNLSVDRDKVGVAS